MPSRYVKIKDEDEKVFKKSVKSQSRSQLYEQLKKEKRLDRFIEVLAICGQRNFSLKDTCAVLTRYFPSYCRRGSGLDPRTLSTMIKLYPEVEEAWTFSKDIRMMRSFINASRIAETTDSMEEVVKFHENFDDTGMGLYRGKEEESSSEEGVTQINIFNSRSEDDIDE